MKGYVTYVKDQGQCGSCWAFSSTGALEGQHLAKTSELVPLSEQNLLDCSLLNFGCNGGNQDLAFDHIKLHHGIDTEQTYPYMAERQFCQFEEKNIGATLTVNIHLQDQNRRLFLKIYSRVMFEYKSTMKQIYKLRLLQLVQ